MCHDYVFATMCLSHPYTSTEFHQRCHIIGHHPSIIYWVLRWYQFKAIQRTFKITLKNVSIGFLSVHFSLVWSVPSSTREHWYWRNHTFRYASVSLSEFSYQLSAGYLYSYACLQEQHLILSYYFLKVKNKHINKLILSTTTITKPLRVFPSKSSSRAYWIYLVCYPWSQLNLSRVPSRRDWIYLVCSPPQLNLWCSHPLRLNLSPVLFLPLNNIVWTLLLRLNLSCVPFPRLNLSHVDSRAAIEFILCALPAIDLITHWPSHRDWICLVCPSSDWIYIALTLPPQLISSRDLSLELKQPHVAATCGPTHRAISQVHLSIRVLLLSS